MINIVDMNNSHLDSIAKIELECFSMPWSVEGFREELKNDKAIFIVAEIDDEVCGYVGMHNILGECYITNIAVDKNYRRLGIGDSLLKTLELRAREKNADFISLEVRISNKSAINLYKKNGYQQVGERKNFYSMPVENAVLMTKTLRGEL